MSKVYNYQSGLADQINAFIAEKRALGCKYEKEAKSFWELDKFLVSQDVHIPELSKSTVEKWIERRPNERRKNQRWRLNFTKRFAHYLRVNGYEAYYPSLSISSRDDADFSPYIFTNAELTALIDYFENLPYSRQYPNGNIVFPLLFKTLMCCGLRAGEAAKLKVKDVDLGRGVLLIQNAKHDKPRYVPLSVSLWAEYEQYYQKLHIASTDEDYFFRMHGAIFTTQMSFMIDSEKHYGTAVLNIRGVDMVPEFMICDILSPSGVCKNSKRKRVTL